MPTLPGLTGTFTILIDPPRWFDSRTANPAPEHRRLHPTRSTEANSPGRGGRW